MSFVLLVSNLRPFTPVSSRNCPHSSQSIWPSHFESEADKVQQPRQILLKVSTLGLDTGKYTQIAVVSVSAKCIFAVICILQFSLISEYFNTF